MPWTHSVSRSVQNSILVVVALFLMYRLPDSRTIPTVTVFDRPGFNGSQASVFSSKYSMGPARSSTTLIGGHTQSDLALNGSHTTLDQLIPPRNALEAARPYENFASPLRDVETNEKPVSEGSVKDWRFWIIFLAVNISILLVAIDLSIISTALPSIASDLDSGELYVWIGNAYVLASSATQPIFGQAANIFGRRSLILISILLFMAGSAIAGAAKSTSIMIAARTIQGAGGGGIITVGEIIINDMLTLRERGQYTGYLSGTYAIGTIIGPILGGIFTQHVSWRWTFYINLPISAVALAISVPFLKLKYNRVGTVWDRAKRVDWVGNAVLIGSVTSILLAMTWGGTKYTWGDWHVTVPLEIGCLGLLAFAWIQVSGYVEEPTMPPRLFKTRTSLAVFLMAFFHGAVLLWVIYFLPVYFQAVLLSSPTRSGVDILPIAMSIAPAAGTAGFLVTKYGRYRRFHWLGWGCMTIGCGLFTLLRPDTSQAKWVIFQIIFGLGNGFVYNTMIPPLLAALPPSEIATATATWSFARAFGGIWGIAIPSAIFNGRVDWLCTQRIAAINPNLSNQLSAGGAYQRATADFVNSVPAAFRATVINIYSDGLKPVWYGSIAFAVIGLPLCLLVKRYDLSNEMEDTGYGVRDRKPGKAAERMHEGWIQASSEAQLQRFDN